MIKVLTLFLLLTTTQAINAEVFKCTSNNGKIIYQSEPCPSTTNTSTVAIETIDPEKVRIAQEKLAEQLKYQAEVDALEADNLLFQREIEALERSARADEERAAAELLQLENQSYEQQPDSYLYYPYYPYYPRRDFKHRDHDRPHPDPRPHKKPAHHDFPRKLKWGASDFSNKNKRGD